MKVHIPLVTVPDPTMSLDTPIHHNFYKAQQDSIFLQNMCITYVLAISPLSV